jgi:hypothetical protein
MFAPLSDKEAALVIGGRAEAQPIGYCYYSTTIFLEDGSMLVDELIVDIITIE